jgi:hypothetical protein
LFSQDEDSVHRIPQDATGKMWKSHRIPQDATGKMWKSHRILQENTENRWNMKAAFRPEVVR